MKWKMPPRIKVMEALGCIADGRISLLNSYEAIVKSSDGTREYKVRWDPFRNAIISTDNGSMKRGYLGYPAIAFLMLQGVLPYDEFLGRKLKGIPWKRLNESLKNYDAVIREITKDWKPEEKKRLEKFINWIMAILKDLGLEVLEEKNATLDRFFQMS